MINEPVSRYARADNRAYQRELAERLTHEMGFGGAVQWCQEFGWNGVMHVLLDQLAKHKG